MTDVIIAEVSFCVLSACIGPARLGDAFDHPRPCQIRQKVPPRVCTTVIDGQLLLEDNPSTRQRNDLMPLGPSFVLKLDET